MKTEAAGITDVVSEDDVDDIVARFYEVMLADSIVGYIFTDVAKINLKEHLPIIASFWCDILFKQKKYRGNAMQKHLELNQQLKLTPGHFTRWLYLFAQAVDQSHAGPNAELMKSRAEIVAKSISAKISDRKKGEMELVLPDKASEKGA